MIALDESAHHLPGILLNSHRVTLELSRSKVLSRYTAHAEVD